MTCIDDCLVIVYFAKLNSYYLCFISQMANKVIHMQHMKLTHISGKAGNGAKKCSGFFTPPRNRGGVIFSLQFVCVSVCLCVCVCVCLCVRLFSCEQNSSRTDAPIWTRFSLNGCLPHWLEPY